MIQIDTNKRYLIAVSGGPDSMALFDMARRCGAYIEAAHMNYHKRDTALRDERIVKTYCERYDIPFHKKDFDETKFTGNFQAAARNARYDFFKEICEERRLDEVLIAHQKDDLIETYLMQKERKLGVSYYGLRQSNTIKGVKVFRPLLGYTKQDLLTYCKDHQISYGIDESNESDDYTRNKIRHHKIDKMSVQDKDALVAIIDEKNRKKEEHYRKACLALNKEKYTILQFKKVPYLKEYLFVHFDHPSASFIKEMKRQLLESKHAYFEGKDICLSKEYDQIFLFPKPKAFFYSFPNIESMFKGKNPYFCFKKEGEKIESICLQNTDFPITVRNAKENDAIALRFGTKKLNRFFIDRKIPMALRKMWPVVVNQKGGVIFVPAIGPDVNHYCEIPNVFMVKL